MIARPPASYTSALSSLNDIREAMDRVSDNAQRVAHLLDEAQTELTITESKLGTCRIRLEETKNNATILERIVKETEGLGEGEETALAVNGAHSGLEKAKLKAQSYDKELESLESRAKELHILVRREKATLADLISLKTVEDRIDSSFQSLKDIRERFFSTK